MKSKPYSSQGAFALLFLIALIVISCKKTDPSEIRALGQLKINVGISVEVFDVYRKFKAATPDEFVISIYSESGTEVISYDRAADLPESVDLPEGSYYVVANSGNNQPAAFENDYYSGQSEVFTISAGETTVISFICILSNIRVTVIYESSVINSFETYTTTVSNPGGSLEFSSTETRAGYFDQGPLNLLAELIYEDGAGNPQTINLTGQIPEPEVGKHYEIHIDAGLTDGYGNIGFTVDESYDTEQIYLSQDTDPEMSGELLITEIMYNPNAVGDANGEYVEIKNVSDSEINLNGLVVLRGGTDDFDQITEDILLAPGQYALLSNGEEAADDVDFIYSGISLVNSGIDLIIATYGTNGMDGNIICHVDYGETGFPLGLSGISIQLDPGIINVNDALVGTNWCASSSVFITGDLGTPGLTNTSCP